MTARVERGTPKQVSQTKGEGPWLGTRYQTPRMVFARWQSEQTRTTSLATLGSSSDAGPRIGCQDVRTWMSLSPLRRGNDGTKPVAPGEGRLKPRRKVPDPMMRIGVLGLQGAFTEHVDAVRASFAKAGIEGTVATVRRKEELASLDGLIMPGGESTTISKLLRAFDLHELLVRRATDEDFPILGTCAGMILLSSEGDGQVEKTDTRLLGLMDMSVNRNAFGRQRESFEASLDIKGFEGPVPGVFIRAPAITRTWGGCEPLGQLGEHIIAARQKNRLALAFHPELTGDTRVHEAFVNLVARWK